MNDELKATLVEITRSQKSDNFRRDRDLIPKSHFELECLNRELKKFMREKKS